MLSGHRQRAYLAAKRRRAEYQWLDEAIERLVACAVIIQTGDQEYVGNLIGSCVRDKATRRYKLTLNPDTIKLYGWKDWTAIDREQRQALRGKPLALWLHGFYSTHAKPYPIKVETLRTLSGSGTKRLSKFKENLKFALRDLETVASIKSTIDGDLVIVERVPTRSQQRHLTRKSKQRAATRTARKKPQNFQRLGDF
jgi:TrfA protein